jgi:hypothetical protein
MNDINTEFGLGRDLNTYRGVRWYRDTNARGYFSAGAISFSDFYGTRKNSPVVAGTSTYTSSQTINFPMFNNLTVTVVSGQGGQGGINGNCAGAGAGGTGGATSFGGYVSAAAASGGSPSGGGGGQNSNTRSWAITDANQASIIALYGQGVSSTVGSGGGGGATGYNTRSENVCVQYAFYYGIPVCTWLVTQYYCDSPAGGGAGGANGYIRLDWN